MKSPTSPARGGGSGSSGGSSGSGPGNPGSSNAGSSGRGGDSNSSRPRRQHRSGRNHDNAGRPSGGSAAPSSSSAAAATVSADAGVENLSLMSDIVELTKARLTLLVLLTTLAGFYLGMNGTVSLTTLAHTLFGTALVAAAASALNQYLEREPDAQMGRTEDRPLPKGRLAAEDVATAAIAAALAGALWLGFLVNWLSSFLAVLTLLIYIFVYTPLKRITSLNTLVGAVPGAIPPVIGWAAARQSVDLQALALFGILFLWQMPHFLAIAWLYREEYSNAGYKMSSLGDHSGGRTAGGSVFYSLLLIPVSMAPYFLGTCNIIYAVIACLLGIAFTWMCTRFFVFPVNNRARQLFLVSIFYLPLLLIAAVLTKNVPH
ncbi:MAG: heme o synthase [Candidatus Methylacidiphilales bacterium]|nr:heme o synthase [Candidatus Methylacidiphilales bacterium]